MHPEAAMLRKNTNLSWEERRDVLPLHDEHVNEVDEDAGSPAGVASAVC